MMPSCVRLLVTLCVVLQCGGSDEAAADASATLDLLRSYLESIVQSATAPAVAGLTAQLDHLQRLQTTVDQSTAQLAAQLEEVRAAIVPPPPRDCSDLTDDATSGIHIVRPGLGRPVPVYCDLDTDGGGWTVFQRRADVQPHQDFYLGWQRYKWGFGALHAEFWWGLEHLWLMTSPLDRRYELRVDMEDFVGGRRHALYQAFTISPEADNYRLTVTSYSGDAGDSLSGHSGHPFSTKDRDNDIYPKSCAVEFRGAWWYTKCHSSNLNGRYLAGNHTSYANGVNWKPWKGYHYSLKRVEMKIRPVSKT